MKRNTYSGPKSIKAKNEITRVPDDRSSEAASEMKVDWYSYELPSTDEALLNLKSRTTEPDSSEGSCCCCCSTAVDIARLVNQMCRSSSNHTTSDKQQEHYRQQHTEAKRNKKWKHQQHQ